MMRLRVFLLLLVLGGCIVPSVAGQGSPLPGVSLECDGGPIEVDANPQRTEQESVFQCEVTNDSALAEEIDLDFEVSGSTFTVAISEDSFSLQGGNPRHSMSRSACRSMNPLGQQQTSTSRRWSAPSKECRSSKPM